MSCSFCEAILYVCSISNLSMKCNNRVKEQAVFFFPGKTEHTAVHHQQVLLRQPKWGPQLDSHWKSSPSFQLHKSWRRPRRSTFILSTIPDDLFIADISVKQQLIFATQHQLQLLVRAKTLYVDATFHVIHKPFTLFLTINVFIRSGEGDNTK